MPTVYIGEVKARKGIIRTTIEIEESSWKVSITGDFMLFPEYIIYDLEARLSKPCNEIEYYTRSIREALSSGELFGCNVEDFIESFKKAYMGAIRECSES